MDFLDECIVAAERKRAKLAAVEENWSWEPDYGTKLSKESRNVLIEFKDKLYELLIKKEKTEQRSISRECHLNPKFISYNPLQTGGFGGEEISVL